jgi:hypothetical protein
LEIDLMSRRTSSQSDDNSIFAQLDGNDTLFGELADDCNDDNLPSLLSDTSRSASLEPIVSINPIRIPFESNSLLVHSISGQTAQQSSVTISPIPPIPSKRGPGRPRKDGKVPIQRKNLFPGRPRMRRQKMGVLGGVGSNASTSDAMAPKPTTSLSSFNIGSGLSIRPVSGNVTPRMSSDSGRVELTISSGSFGSSQKSSSLSHNNSDDSNNDNDAKLITKVCVFCNLGESSSLGLGALIHCEPTPGFSPFKRSARLRRSPERETTTGVSTTVDNGNSISQTRNGM